MLSKKYVYNTLLVLLQKQIYEKVFDFPKKAYICTETCIYYADPAKLINFKKHIMAKPIKETPILYDEDAYRFEMAAHNVKMRVYEEVKKRCTFPV